MLCCLSTRLRHHAFKDCSGSQSPLVAAVQQHSEWCRGHCTAGTMVACTHAHAESAFQQRGSLVRSGYVCRVFRCKGQQMAGSPCPCPELGKRASGCSITAESVPQQMLSPVLLDWPIACPAVHCKGSRPDQRGRPGEPPGAAEAELGPDALCGRCRQRGPRRLHEGHQRDIWAVPRGGQLPKVR